MIITFRDAETEKVWRGQFSLSLPRQIQATARRKLRMLHNARVIEDLCQYCQPNCLEKLGDRTASMSIRINDQWRVCFYWTDDKTEEVEICDYH